MDASQIRERCRFLFGTGHPDIDVDDDDALIDHFDALQDDDRTAVTANPELAAAVARHLLDGDGELWSAAQRLVASGLGRRDALDQLAFALQHALTTGEYDNEDDDEDDGGDDRQPDPFGPIVDPERLRITLAWLPLADDEELVAALEAVVALEPTTPADDVAPAVVERMGLDVSNELLLEQVELALDAGTMAGVLRMLPGDLVAHVPTLTAGIVLTHRLTVAEADSDRLTCISNDLAAFSWYDDLTLAGAPDGATIGDAGALDLGAGAIEVDGDEDGMVHWSCRRAPWHHASPET